LPTHTSRNEAKREKRTDEWSRPRILPQFSQGAASAPGRERASRAATAVLLDDARFQRAREPVERLVGRARRAVRGYARHGARQARLVMTALRSMDVDARRKRHGCGERSNCHAAPNSCDRSIYRAGEIQAIVRNCARRGFPMAKTFLLVSFSAPACGCVAFFAGLAVVAFGSSAQAQFGVPGAIPPFTMPEAAAGAITADCYYEWKGRGGRTYQCPVAPAPPKKPEAKK
jgi:hypothetical protein